MAERKKRTTKKKPKVTSILPKMEVIFIFVLLICFFIWALTKCSTTPKIDPLTEETEEIISPAAGNNPDSPTYDLGESETNNTVTPPVNRGETEVIRRNDNIPKSGYTPLYVTLQDLKVRKGPSRDSSIVSVLSLHEEVMFLEKRTDFREKISNGSEIMNDPWIFVQTRKGHKGWVYGGGVHFFKWDRLKDPIPTITNEADAEGK